MWVRTITCSLSLVGRYESSAMYIRICTMMYFTQNQPTTRSTWDTVTNGYNHVETGVAVESKACSRHFMWESKSLTSSSPSPKASFLPKDGDMLLARTCHEFAVAPLWTTTRQPWLIPISHQICAFVATKCLLWMGVVGYFRGQDSHEYPGSDAAIELAGKKGCCAMRPRGCNHTNWLDGWRFDQVRLSYAGLTWQTFLGLKPRKKDKIYFTACIDTVHVCKHMANMYILPHAYSTYGGFSKIGTHILDGLLLKPIKTIKTG